MAKSKTGSPKPLAERWSPPDHLEAGAPLACVATTYTFHAPLLESDLLPRFLGLKFDNMESERPFEIEREQALGSVRACVLVDQDHIDPSQTTLRWDQLAVRVPGGVQHAKLVLLVWENCVRLMVSSANLTRTGYRRNREIAAVLDFYDDPGSVPRQPAVDAVTFLEELVPWTRGPEGPVERLRETLQQVRDLLARWRNIPADFTPREMPRVHFIGGLPARRNQELRSSLSQTLDLWGNLKASEVIVMTPFVGDVIGPTDPVVERLVQVTHGRDTTARLIVPGRIAQADSARMLVNLPRRFLEAWAQAWGVEPADVPTHVVPLCRVEAGEKVNRDLHAKGLLLAGERTSLLLCGSSNFSPHGMGVGVANVEANLCYLARTDEKAGGLWLRDRLLDRWQEDEVEDAIWPAQADPPEEDAPASVPRLPAVFLWASLDQQQGILTLGLDPHLNFPAEWAIRLPGERSRQLPPLADQSQAQSIPLDGLMTVLLPESLRKALFACLAVTWREEGTEQTALLPVQVDRPESLLAPEEFRSLTADGIIACILAGKELAELVEQQERHRGGKGNDALESLRAVDTSGYALYRIRRLGRALAVLGERLLHSVRTRDALAYRLLQHPLGPCLLADALVRHWTTPGNDSAPLLFGLAEVCLTVAHAGQRMRAERSEGDPDLCPIFHEAIAQIQSLTAQLPAAGEAAGLNLQEYVANVRARCEQLLGSTTNGDTHAS